MKHLIRDTIHPQGKITISVSSDFAVFPLPRVIRVEPSSLCNLRCIHCPVGLDEGLKKGNMLDGVFNQIIEELLTLERIDVIVLYHGGEPFLNKKIFKMIQVLKSIGNPFTKMNTNGMLLLNIIGKIIKSGIDDLYISLDGLSPEENNSIRRGSDYYRIVSLVKKLLLKKIELHSKTPNICISNVQIPTKTQAEQKVEPEIPQFLHDEFADFLGQIKFQSGFAIKWADCEIPDDFTLTKNSVLKSSPNYCDQLIQTITIRWNGDVVPCCYDITGQFILGNIMKESISKIWNNLEYRKLRKNIFEKNYPSLCKKCKMISPGFHLTWGN